MSRSCEAEIHDLLFDGLSSVPGAAIHSWSPPNAKAYRAPNLVLPKLIKGVRKGSDRVDAVFAHDELLFLVEIKCKLSETAGDVRKLRRIRSTLGAKGVLEALRRQGASVGTIRDMVVGLAVREVDSVIPGDMMVMAVGRDSVESIMDGTGLAAALVEALTASGQK